MKNSDNQYQIKRNFGEEKRRLIFSKTPYENLPLPFLKKKKSIAHSLFDLVLNKCKSVVELFSNRVKNLSEDEIVFEEEANNLFNIQKNENQTEIKPEAKAEVQFGENFDKTMQPVMKKVRDTTINNKRKLIQKNLSFESQLGLKRNLSKGSKNKYQLLVKKRKSGEEAYKILPKTFIENEPLSPITEVVESKPKQKAYAAPKLPKKEFYVDLGEIKPKHYKINFGLENLYSADTSESNPSDNFDPASESDSGNSAASIKKVCKKNTPVTHPVSNDLNSVELNNELKDNSIATAKINSSVSQFQVPSNIEGAAPLINQEYQQEKETKNEKTEISEVPEQQNQSAMPQISLFGGKNKFSPLKQNFKLTLSSDIETKIVKADGSSNFHPNESEKSNEVSKNTNLKSSENETISSDKDLNNLKENKAENDGPKSLFSNLVPSSSSSSQGLFFGLGLFGNNTNNNNNNAQPNQGNTDNQSTATKLESTLFASKKKHLLEEIAERNEETKELKPLFSSGSNQDQEKNESQANQASAINFSFIQNTNTVIKNSEPEKKENEMEQKKLENLSVPTNNFFNATNHAVSLSSLMSSSQSKGTSNIKSEISDFDKEQLNLSQPKSQNEFFTVKPNQMTIFDNGASFSSIPSVQPQMNTFGVPNSGSLFSNYSQQSIICPPLSNTFNQSNSIFTNSASNNTQSSVLQFSKQVFPASNNPPGFFSSFNQNMNQTMNPNLGGNLFNNSVTPNNPSQNFFGQSQGFSSQGFASQAINQVPFENKGMFETQGNNSTNLFSTCSNNTGNTKRGKQKKQNRIGDF